MAKDKGHVEESDEESRSSEGDPNSQEESSSDSSSSSSSEEEDDAPTRDGLGPPCSAKILTKFYGQKKRVDNREVTCILNKESLKLYFKTIVGDGKLDREGRKELSMKYFMGSKQYHKLSPPSLEETRLHCIDKKEYGLLSEKLLFSHM